MTREISRRLPILLPSDTHTNSNQDLRIANRNFGVVAEREILPVAIPSTSDVEWTSQHTQRRVLLRRGAGDDRIVVCAPDGAVELAVRLTATGPVLEFRGASLELTATKNVSVRCERFIVDATDAVALNSGGDMSQRAGGDSLIEAAGQSKLVANAVEVTASTGNVEVRANDEVVIEGERIWLNR
jgi:hypothetical protein